MGQLEPIDHLIHLATAASALGVVWHWAQTKGYLESGWLRASVTFAMIAAALFWAKVLLP